MTKKYVQILCVSEKMEDALCPVTVILTTSPTHSNPSTELINAVLVSFRLVSGLKSATILIVADGCVVHDKSRWKSGWVTPEQRIALSWVALLPKWGFADGRETGPWVVLWRWPRCGGSHEVRRRRDPHVR